MKFVLASVLLVLVLFTNDALGRRAKAKKCPKIPRVVETKLGETWANVKWKEDKIMDPKLSKPENCTVTRIRGDLEENDQASVGRHVIKYRVTPPPDSDFNNGACKVTIYVRAPTCLLPETDTYIDTLLPGTTTYVRRSGETYVLSSGDPVIRRTCNDDAYYFPATEVTEEELYCDRVGERIPNGIRNATLRHETLECEFCPARLSYTRCNNTGECIPRSYICDDYIDCPDLEDERNCICSNAGEVRCNETMHCIPRFFVCNGQDNCGDNEDEQHCVGSSSMMRP